MYYKKFYHTLNEEEIIGALREEEFNPIKIVDEADYEYRPHSHPESKVVVLLKGSMTVHVLGEEYQCEPGDKILIPGNIEHSATVGPGGCEFLWAEKMI